LTPRFRSVADYLHLSGFRQPFMLFYNLPPSNYGEHVITSSTSGWIQGRDIIGEIIG